MQYSLGKVTSHQKVANISDFVEYDGNYHKEYEAGAHCEKSQFLAFFANQFVGFAQEGNTM